MASADRHPRNFIGRAKPITPDIISARMDFFLSRIRKDSSGCWIWTGTKSDRGYGMLRHTGERYQTHRFSVAAFQGDLGPEDVVCHTCDTPSCVNPDHLYRGTHLDNMADRSARGRAIGPRGELSGSAKLTEQDVREIRAASGNHAETARRFNVSDALVRAIRKRTRWGHIV